jgi:twitching motility protein PilT
MRDNLIPSDNGIFEPNEESKAMVQKILTDAISIGASDIFILPGSPIVYKIHGKFHNVTKSSLNSESVLNIIKILYWLAQERSMSRCADGDDDFAVMIPSVGRYRVNIYSQRFSLACVLRTVVSFIPNPKDYHIPDTIVNLANYKKGIVLFTGTTGSGKSTSLACLIDKINREREGHIVTLEDPIEYRHDHKRSIVSQRELDTDTKDYSTALRAVLRQAPNVILIGEMRDYETIHAAITAAETGHLVFSTLHTMDAASTIERIVDVFPSSQQNQIRIQLAMTLQAVVSQQLIPSIDGRRRPAFEILIATSAVKNLIRENKTFQIESILQTSSDVGMRTMNMSILELYSKGVITKENALTYSSNPNDLVKRLNSEQKFR